MAEQTISLSPGESKVVSFEATPSEARAYQVSVDMLTGNFSAVAAPAVEVADIVVNPTTLTGARHEYETGLGIGHWGDPFNIEITFKNPLDTDIWLRPDFALGRLNGSPLKVIGEEQVNGFNAENLLYFRLLLNTEYVQGDYSMPVKWQNPFNARGENKLSNMVLGIYDPDNVPRTIGAADYWIKIPPNSSVTASMEAHLSGELTKRVWKCATCGQIIEGSVQQHYADNHPGIEVYCWSWGGWGGCNIVDNGEAAYQVDATVDWAIGTWDLCVASWKAYYFVYDPGYGQQRVGNQWVTVNWRPMELEPVAAAVPHMITITPASIGD